MTVDTTTSNTVAVIAGSVNEQFTIPFRFDDNADLRVYTEDPITGTVVELSENTDYNVIGAGNATGGTLTLVGSRTVNDFMHIDRWVDPKQPTKLPLTGAIPSTSVERMSDRLTFICQQLIRLLDAETWTPGTREYLGLAAANAQIWEGKTRRLQNLLDGVNAQDAATKGQIDSAILGAGSLPTPGDPGDNFKVLQARSGVTAYHDVAVRAPVAADIGGVLRARSAADGGYTWSHERKTNVVINGDFSVWNRAGTQTLAVADAGWATDRWLVLSDGAGVVDARRDLTVDIPDDAFTSLELEVQTASKKFGIITFIEGRDAKNLIGRPVSGTDGLCSLSFRAKTESGQVENVRAGVVAWSGPTQDVVTRDIVSAWEPEGTNPTLITNATFENTPVNIGLTDDWQTFAIEGIQIDTANTKNLAVFIWVDDTDLVVNDKLHIADVQLEQGAHATPFARRLVSEEERLCRRYFVGTFNPTATPADNTGSVDGALHASQAGNGAANVEGCYWHFGQPMHKDPTITTYNPRIGGTAGEWASSGGAADRAAAVIGIGRQGVYISVAAPGFNSSNRYGIHATADAEL